MVKFITSDVYKYLDEKDRRQEIYKKACEYSRFCWNKYHITNDKDDFKICCEATTNLDVTYIDWVDNVILESKY